MLLFVVYSVPKEGSSLSSFAEIRDIVKPRQRMAGFRLHFMKIVCCEDVLQKPPDVSVWRFFFTGLLEHIQLVQLTAE